ncbi:hypothetical protein JD969_06260 [Planctomycetota bacterium]|nr:hypothetical protein JD969_06260 [Planctomycetota bacterium]
MRLSNGKGNGMKLVKSHLRSREIGDCMKFFSLLIISALSLSLVGCTVKVGGGSKTVNDVVTENLELRKEVKELNEELELRMAEVKALHQQVQAGKEPIPGAEAPVLSRIKLGRYSGPISTEGQGGDTQVVAYVQPEDQLGRMLPVAGIGTLQVVYIPDEGEPRMVIDKRFNAKSWQEAYRSNFTGTHYTLKADLPSDMPPGTYDCTLRVTFRQTDTGAVFSTQLPIKIMREAFTPLNEGENVNAAGTASGQAAQETVADESEAVNEAAADEATGGEMAEPVPEDFQGNDARPEDAQ